MTFTLTSTSFGPDGTIPVRHTCDGADVSPPLAWSGAPAGTAAFALIQDDPDAPRPGGFVHWVAYDVPASVTRLPEGVSRDERPAELHGGLQGTNDFRRIGFNGSCPPPGTPHHYHFTLYALDSALSLGPGATRAQVAGAMKGHVLGQAELIGRYGRSR